MEDLEFFELKKIDTEKIREYVLNALDSESITDKSLFNRMLGTVGKEITYDEETLKILKNHWAYKYIYSDYFRAELFYKKEKGRYFLCKRELIGSIILSINTSLTTNKALKEKRFYSSDHKNIKKELQKDIKIIEDFRDLFFNKLKLSNNDKSISIVFNEDKENLAYLNDYPPFEYKNINALFDKLINNLSMINGNKKDIPHLDYRFNFHSVYYAQTILGLKRDINKFVCMHYSFEYYETLDFTYEIGLLIEFLQENKII
ncbi:hypothetical protein N5T98_01875 [Aliarcobacter cryaerophilus]|uniref:hypothetical protein n=1 Tax=Aliarcobacter cryaerophilus TaxID=28198 RepID=UPI0021B51992|nr:hypothetical protein [Aliarcobacter cryaerophilus]MCT7484991.1 hypothetical protein [Aliarcobacter cryaerophilus]MCT7489839.1 hypothetical protein [Aliarcobacter cryaerophilus]